MEYVPDRYKIQKLFKKASKRCLYALERAPYWLVTEEIRENMDTHDVNTADDDNYSNKYAGLVEWYDEYKQRQSVKAEIKEKV